MFELGDIQILIDKGTYSFLSITSDDVTNFDKIKSQAEAEITFACGVSAENLSNVKTADQNIIKTAFAASVEYLSMANHGGFNEIAEPIIRRKYLTAIDKLSEIRIVSEDDPDGVNGVGQIGVAAW